VVKNILNYLYLFIQMIFWLYITVIKWRAIQFEEDILHATGIYSTLLMNLFL